MKHPEEGNTAFKFTFNFTKLTLPLTQTVLTHIQGISFSCIPNIIKKNTSIDILKISKLNPQINWCIYPKIICMLKVVIWDQLSANRDSHLKKILATFLIMLVVSIRTSVLSWKLCAAAKYPILCLQRRWD